MERLVEVVQRRALERSQRGSSAPRRRCWSRARAAPTRRRLRGRTPPQQDRQLHGPRPAGGAGRGRDHRRDLDDAGGRGVPGRTRRLTSSPSSARRGSARPRSRSSLPTLLRERGEDPVAVSADAIAVYEGLDVLAAKPADRAARAPAGVMSCRSTRSSAPAGSRRWRMPRSTICWTTGRTPIVVGGTGLYLRAALTELDLRPPVEPDLRAGLERELAEVGPAALHGRLSPATAAAVHPNDRKRIVRALELEQTGTAPHPASGPAVVRGAAAPHRAVRDRRWTATRSGPGSRRGWARCSPAARSRRSSAPSSGARRARRARRSGSRRSPPTSPARSSLDEVRARIERGHRAYVRRQLTWMRKLVRGGDDRPHRPVGARRGRSGSPRPPSRLAPP